MALFATAPAVASPFLQQLPPDTIPAATDTLAPDTLALDSLPPDSFVLSPSAIEKTITYTAKDTIRYSLDGKIVHLWGEAVVQYDDIELKAEYIRYNTDSSTVYAYGLSDSTGKVRGNPVFTEGETTYKASKIAYNFETEKGKVWDVITEQGEGYLHGSEVKKSPFDVLYVKDAKYTTCNLAHPHFYIATNRAKVVPGKQVVTGASYLVVADVPLPLVLPFGFFPDQEKQASGIIIPKYGETPARGFFLRQGGFFFTVNDYLNFAVTGDIYSRGDYRLQGAVNYAKRYRYQGLLSASRAVLHEGEPETDDYVANKAYEFVWQHTQSPKAHPYNNFSASVNVATSDYNRQLSETRSAILQNSLNSSIRYSRTFPNSPFSFNAAARLTQKTLPDQANSIYLELPTAAFQMSRVYPFRSKKRVGRMKWYEQIGMNYNLEYKNQLQTVDTVFFEFDDEMFNDFRHGVRHSIPLSMNLKFLKHFTFSPSFNYNGWFYFDRSFRDWDFAADTLVTKREQGFYYLNNYTANAAINTTVYGMFNVNKLGVQAVRHVMYPSISLAYSPDFSEARYGYYTEYQDSSLKRISYSPYNDNIFRAPGAGELGALNFSLRNTLEMKVRSKNDTITGTKKISIFDQFTLSSSYNFLADSFELSPVAFRVSNRISNNFNVSLNGNFDPYARSADGSRRVDEMAFTREGRLGYLSYANLSVNANLNPEANVPPWRPAFLPTTAPTHYYYPYSDYYVDFDIPWNLSTGYTLNYNNSPGSPLLVTQSLNIAGELKLTDKWKVNANIDYDLTEKKLGYTTFNIYRDLHCWEMRFRINPFGEYKSYSFTLQVKAGMLQDLKLEKQRQQRDY